MNLPDDDVCRFYGLCTWVYRLKHQAASPEVLEAAASRGCPVTLPVLILAWVIRRRCPVCRRRMLPVDETMGAGSLARLCRQHFCSDLCSRYSEDLSAPTLDELKARALEVQRGWTPEVERERRMPSRDLLRVVADDE